MADELRPFKQLAKTLEKIHIALRTNGWYIESYGEYRHLKFPTEKFTVVKLGEKIKWSHVKDDGQVDGDDLESFRNHLNPGKQFSQGDSAETSSTVTGSSSSTEGLFRIGRTINEYIYSSSDGRRVVMMEAK
jgi:hypothetical protein